MKRIILVFALFSSHHSSLYPQDFWEQTNGPYAGIIYAIASDPINGYLYSGNWDGGIYLSTNNGRTWKEKNQSILNYYISSIIVNNLGTVFAGTPSSIYRSTNYGDDWEVSLFQFPGWFISFATNSSGHIFAGTDRGRIHRTTDNGETWTEVYNDGNNWIYAITVDNKGNIFAATSYYGVLCSENNGTSWVFKNNGITHLNTHSISANAKNGKIYCGTGNGLYESSDFGENWTNLNTDFINLRSIQFLSDESIVVSDYFNVFLSSDGGISWDSISSNSEIENLTINRVFTNSLDEIFVASHGEGIFLSTDRGLNWELSSNGITNTKIKNMMIDNDDNIYVGAYYAGINKSTDGGHSFNRINNGLFNRIIHSMAYNSNNDLFLGTSGDGVFRSTNGGNTWTQTNQGLLNPNIRSLLILKNGTIFCGTDNRVFRSLNNGSSWIPSGLLNCNVLYLSADSIGNIWAGIYNYSDPFNPKFFLSKSSDIGISWHEVQEFSGINGLYVDLNGNLYVLSYFVMNISNNQGQTWTQAVFPNLVTSVTSNSNNTLFVGTNNGVYSSDDLGNSWTELRTGFPSGVIGVECIEVDSKGYLYAGIWNKTLYKSKKTTTDVRADEQIELYYHISQNYPNPFNPSTKISWQSPIGSHQVLKVFDVLGREVATLVDEYRNAGYHEVEFNAAGLSSGVYFYRIQAGDYVETKKMVLLR